MNGYPRAAVRFVAAATVAGAAVFVVALWHMPADQWGSLGVLTALSLVAGPALQARNRKFNLSLGAVAILAAMLITGPAAATVIAPVITFERDQVWLKRLFNGSMMILSAGFSGLVLHLVDQITPIGGPLGRLAPAVAANVAFQLLNFALVACVVAFAQGASVRAVSLGLCRGMPAAFAFGMFGYLLYVLWVPGGVGPFSALLLLLPLYVARFTYLQFAEEQKAYDSTVRALVRAVETKDVYTRGHSERVARASVMIANQIGMRADRVEALRFAGILHDLGKLGVPTRVLQKEGSLTDDEFGAVQLHPVRGREMIREIAFLEDAQAGIMHHHERMDGLGYPMGLMGAQIPEFARVIAVADAFDSMTSTRSYRGARSVELALAELNRCSGSQFDPVMVAAMVRSLEREEWIPSESSAEASVRDEHSMSVMRGVPHDPRPAPSAVQDAP